MEAGSLVPVTKYLTLHLKAGRLSLSSWVEVSVMAGMVQPQEPCESAAAGYAMLQVGGSEPKSRAKI